MALENGGGSDLVMPVSPMYGGGGNGGFGNGFGDSGWWIILLFLFALGGWGNNGFGGGNGGGGAMPYIYTTTTNNDVQRGFDQAAIMGGINALTSNVCNGFADVQQSLCNGFANAEVAANARQIADMQQNFALQTAITGGFTNLSSQFADCCCENRLGIANLGSDLAREACATRTNDTQNTQAILNTINGGIQSIKDQLCSDKIDAKNEKIADLERQLTMANLSASQIAQTAAIRAGQVEEIDAMYNRLRDCPVPTMPVYGSQPIFTCPNNNSCGCGCGVA